MKAILTNSRNISKHSLIKFSFYAFTKSIEFPLNLEIKRQFQANNYKLEFQDFSSSCLAKNIIKGTTSKK